MAIKTSVIALMIGASILAGCSKSSDADEAAVEKDPVKRRMNDPVYVAKLNDLNAARKEIMKATSQAIKALEDAKAANADVAVIAKLQAQVDKCGEMMKQHTIKARQTVADQMRATQSK